jgi:hypothetical protein
MQYTREDLIAICEKAIVPVSKWSNRDTPQSQEGIGKVWVLLKTGCPFTVIYEEDSPGVITNERTIWLRITSPVFSTFDSGRPEYEELFYLPTLTRIEACSGEDWY